MSVRGSLKPSVQTARGENSNFVPQQQKMSVALNLLRRPCSFEAAFWCTTALHAVTMQYHQARVTTSQGNCNLVPFGSDTEFTSGAGFVCQRKRLKGGEAGGIQLITRCPVNGRFLGQRALTSSSLGLASETVGTTSICRSLRMCVLTPAFVPDMPVCWNAVSHEEPCITWRMARAIKRTTRSCFLTSGFSITETA